MPSHSPGSRLVSTTFSNRCSGRRSAKTSTPRRCAVPRSASRRSTCRSSIAGSIAAYVLARVSVRPLIDAREREAQFAADAAHELRTPLARIASVAQSARAHADPDARDAALARVAELAVEASATVGDLLSLMREERVAPRLSEPIDLAALVDDAAGMPRGPGIALDVLA